MNMEIRKVANGYVVLPANSNAVGMAWAADDIHVFRTWAQVSAWMRRHFEFGKHGRFAPAERRK